MALAPLEPEIVIVPVVAPPSTYDTEASPDRDTAATAAEEAITDAAVRAISFFMSFKTLP
jgi:hypothetical protein